MNRNHGDPLLDEGRKLEIKVNRVDGISDCARRSPPHLQTWTDYVSMTDGDGLTGPDDEEPSQPPPQEDAPQHPAVPEDDKDDDDKDGAADDNKEDESGDEDEEEEEPRLKYATLTKNTSSIYRSGDALSSCFVAGDKLVSSCMCLSSRKHT